LIGASNRIQTAFREAYQLPSVDNKAYEISESFGDKRYLINSQYLMKRVDNLQSAFGAEFRIDDLGKDMEGLNVAGNGNFKRPAISNVLYTNFALYTENYYNLQTSFGDLGFVGGLRMDKHTRTDFVLNPKLAVVYSPNENNTIKAIFQSSANNGSADNYEFNRNHYQDNGTIAKEPFLEKATEKNGAVIPAVKQSDLHNLKPEKILSYELASNHKIADFLTISPSLSYNNVQNLFVWNQSLLRVVNGNEFNFFSAEADLRYQKDNLTIGFSHVFQRPINTSTTSTVSIDIPNTNIVEDSGNPGKYKAVLAEGSKKVDFNPTKDQITSDGNNFLNLSTNISKAYITYKLPFEALSFITLHTNLRTFWGLNGRDSLYKEDEAKGFNYLNITRMPMVKWNASVHFDLPMNFTLSTYAYDILGTSNNLNSVRWQQMAFPDQKDIYAVDQNAFAIRLERIF
jgi:hypothetical protein